MLILIALFVPRLVTHYLWFFTEWFSGVFGTLLWPILGFVFMPYTMLWYSVVTNWFKGEWGVWQIIVGIIAAIADLSSDGGVRRSRNR